jgi:K+-sensing histidine kinase KdpD
MTIHASQQQPDLTQARCRNTAEQAQAGDVLRQLAHDLRQPVAAILALAAAAAADAQASQDVLLRLRQIVDEASWVSTAIDDLLADFAAGAAQCHEPVQISALVRDVVNTERLTYHGQITADEPGRAPRYVMASATTLRRALANVLANATRAAGSDGHVRVSQRGDDAVELIEIADDGPGFGHVSPAHGIGLGVTRRILNGCGGRMEIEQHSSGQTLVRLILPVAPTATGPGVT